MNDLANFTVFLFQLAGLPESFINLQALTTLDLFNNCLDELPDVMKQLQNLTRLDLDQNRFKLNVMDVPQIVHTSIYPHRETSGGDNWRNRRRQDLIHVNIEKVNEIVTLAGKRSFA